MSTATPFLFKGRSFPFCPEVFDIDAFEASLGAVNPQLCWIRDLTLHDAMKLYWNLETIDLALNVSGCVYADFFLGENVTLSCDASDNIGPASKAPRERVCSLGTILQATSADTNNETLAFTHPLVVSPFTNHVRHQILIDLQDGGFPTPNEWCVSEQEDGLYTFWFYIFGAGDGGPYEEDSDDDPETPNETYDYPLARCVITGRGEDYASAAVMATGLYEDIAVLSGTMRLYFAVNQDDAGESIITPGTLNTLTFTPNFFTY